MGDAARPRRVGMFAATVATAVALVGASLPGTAGALGRVADHPVPVTARPGPVAAEWSGTAYPVPVEAPAAGAPDGVTARLELDGRKVGTTVLPSGTPVRVRPVDGKPSLVAVRQAKGRVAVAPRAQFWVMPAFLDLEHLRAPVDGTMQPVNDSIIDYHRGNTAYFDDPTTPQYEGTTIKVNRDFLECKRDDWGMGGQTFAVDPIEMGVARGDKAMTDQGVSAIDWGVAVPIAPDAIHQLHRACDGTTVPDYGYTHHTTQWLAALGQVVYLLASSPWAGAYREHIDRYVARIDEIAMLEARPANWKHWVGEIRDNFGNDFTHRTFMMAAAMGLASTLAPGRADATTFAQKAATIAKRGIANQRADGVNPERGGFDVEYQMYGTWLLQVYLSTLAPNDPMRPRVERTIDKAVEWMTTRVEPNGQIRIPGTTRVCVETLWSRKGRAPSLDPAETIRGFLLWGHLTGDERLVGLAVKVNAAQKSIGNPCPADYYGTPEPQAKG